MSDRPPRTAEEETEGRRLLAAAYRRLLPVFQQACQYQAHLGDMLAKIDL